MPLTKAARLNFGRAFVTLESDHIVFHGDKLCNLSVEELLDLLDFAGVKAHPHPAPSRQFPIDVVSQHLINVANHMLDGEWDVIVCDADGEVAAIHGSVQLVANVWSITDRHSSRQTIGFLVPGTVDWKTWELRPDTYMSGDNK